MHYALDLGLYCLNGIVHWDIIILLWGIVRGTVDCDILFSKIPTQARPHGLEKGVRETDFVGFLRHSVPF